MKALFLLISLFVFCRETATCGLRTVGKVHSSTRQVFNDADEDQLNVVFQKNLILDDIQQKIKDAVKEDLVHKSTKALLALEMALEQEESNPVALKNYWIAYINYLKTVAAWNQKDLVTAEQADEKGIRLLEKNTAKNADDYALLVLLKGLSFYFAPETDAMRIYLEIEGLLYAGLAQDKNNIRLQYAQGLLDFYTPKEYGGGDKAEKFLINTIERPETNLDHRHQPTWGKEEAYDILIQYYLREHKIDRAKKYFKEGKFTFPNSAAILQHQGSF